MTITCQPSGLRTAALCAVAVFMFGPGYGSQAVAPVCATALDGTACDSGDACSGDVCRAGVCVAVPCTCSGTPFTLLCNRVRDNKDNKDFVVGSSECTQPMDDLQVLVKVRAEVDATGTLVIEVYSGAMLQTSDTFPLSNIADNDNLAVPRGALFVPVPSVACGIRRTVL